MQGIHPSVEPQTHVVVFVRALAMNADGSHSLGEMRIIREYRTAVSITTQRLGREKAGCPHMTMAWALSTSVFRQVLEQALHYPIKPVSTESGKKFTTRELEILGLVARGQSNKDIAQLLELSLRTIKSHLVDIFNKLKVFSRTEAVITGLRGGFLKLEDLG